MQRSPTSYFGSLPQTLSIAGEFAGAAAERARTKPDSRSLEIRRAEIIAEPTAGVQPLPYQDEVERPTRGHPTLAATE
jgi:hypothetical protein